MNPMMAKPIAVAMAIFWNSRDKENENMNGLKLPFIRDSIRIANEGGGNLPFLSGLVHLLTSLIESLTNCRLGSMNCVT